VNKVSQGLSRFIGLTIKAKEETSFHTGRLASVDGISKADKTESLKAHSLFVRSKERERRKKEQ